MNLFILSVYLLTYLFICFVVLYLFVYRFETLIINTLSWPNVYIRLWFLEFNV